MSLDVFTLGEAMLRLSTPVGQSLETSPEYHVHVAGSEANVASTLSQLGRSTMWSSRIPDSVLGHRILSSLRSVGVDCDSVALSEGGRLGTYFVDIRPAPLSTVVVYDRAASAVCDMGLEEIDWLSISEARVVHLSGITPALSPNLAEVVSKIVSEVRESESLLTFDVNYRAKLWTPKEAEWSLSSLLDSVDVLVCGIEDARVVFGVEGTGPEVSVQLSERFSNPSVVVTAGAGGAFWRQGTQAGHIPALPVRVVDPLGAGDAFMAGLIDGVLDDDLKAGVARGAALAGIALATVGDQIRITRAGMLSLLEGDLPDVDR
jgi:2-dehydro-3-deoxygluconokinase